MKFFQSLIYLLLLIVTPTFLITPQVRLEALENVPFGQACHRALNSENNLLFSYDEVMALIDELESDHIPEDYLFEEIEAINRYLAGLALEGVLPGDSTRSLENDIALLLAPTGYDFEYANFYCDRDFIFLPHGEVMLCKNWLKKNWEKTKEFVKDHKKEIIIGAAIVIAVTTVVIIVAASSAGAVATVAAAGITASLPEKEEAPAVQKTIEESVSSFKELASEDVVLESINYKKDSSAKETFKDLGALLAHETLNGISEVSSMIPHLGEELKELAAQILPKSLLLPENSELLWNESKHDELLAKGHEVIDHAFATNQSVLYTPEVKATHFLNQFNTPIMPPPGGMARGVSFSKFREIVVKGRETVAVADELGFTAREITELEKKGVLEKAVASKFENLIAQSESEVFKAALSNNKHVKMVRDYLNKPAKEIQKGIKSYEKQIAIHKDKITSPTKHYPNWDKLDSRQREALINKKWPVEIKGYEEQLDVLQSILNERLSYE